MTREQKEKIKELREIRIGYRSLATASGFATRISRSRKLN